jgi:hypothetical protein
MPLLLYLLIVIVFGVETFMFVIMRYWSRNFYESLFIIVWSRNFYAIVIVFAWVY